jgi:hypothetical protein
LRERAPPAVVVNYPCGEPLPARSVYCLFPWRCP